MMRTTRTTSNIRIGSWRRDRAGRRRVGCQVPAGWRSRDEDPPMPPVPSLRAQLDTLRRCGRGMRRLRLSQRRSRPLRYRRPSPRVTSSLDLRLRRRHSPRRQGPSPSLPFRVFLQAHPSLLLYLDRQVSVPTRQIRQIRCARSVSRPSLAPRPLDRRTLVPPAPSRRGVESLHLRSLLPPAPSHHHHLR